MKFEERLALASNTEATPSELSKLRKFKDERILRNLSRNPNTPIDILFGHRASVAKGNLYMSHKGGFTEKTLKQEFIKVGFSKVVSMSRAAHFDIWVLAAKKGLPDNEIRSLALKHFPK